MVQFIEGILKIANLFLAIVAGIIAATLFKVSRKKELKPWMFLIVALIFFAIQEILGALRAFEIFSTPYLTHVVPTIILVLLVIALILQINMVKK
ncbi:hypothetical protein J4209_07025 [Candidatus Woesearchaeota archaeon]|nr:hypothetical protein [Candidatus Woesearchaeota archaeon]